MYNKVVFVMFFIAIGILLSSCSTKPMTQFDVDAIKAVSKNNAEINKANALIAKQPSYTFEGDGRYRIKVYDGDKQKFMNLMPLPTNANDVDIASSKDIKDGIVKVLPIITGIVGATIVATDFIEAMGGNNVTTHNTSTIVGDDNTQTATTDVSKVTHDGITDFSAIDNSAVSTPTIVEQPPVQIVTQPPVQVVKPEVIQVPTQIIEVPIP